MEKNIFKFGNSSLALIVPKGWTKKHGIKAGSGITVNEDSAGNLVLSTKQSTETKAFKVISRRTDPHLVWRWVGVYYRFGVRRLEIASRDGFTQEQISALKEQIELYSPGFEIMNQTANAITIEDLTEQKDIDLGKIMARMRSLIDESFRELIDGELEKMEGTEALINRFYQLCLRYINIIQPAGMLKYFRITEAMEEIGDLLLDISHIDCGRSKSANSLLVRAREKFVLSEKAFGGDEDAIKQIYEFVGELRGERKGVADRDCSDLVGEISKYINYIAEFGLTAESKVEEGL